MSKVIIMVENQYFKSDVKIGAHHYAEIFANNGNTVIWVTPPYTIFHKFIKKHKDKKFSWIRKYDNIIQITPFLLLPIYKLKIIPISFSTAINTFSVFLQIKLFFLIKGYRCDILWITNLKLIKLNKFMNHNLSIHRVNDKFAGFENFDKRIEKVSLNLIKSVDIVFATSNNLYEYVENYRSDVKLLPNGVNFRDFQREKYILPKEYNGIGNKPIIVYIGSIGEMLDFELIDYITRKLQDYYFIFIGKDTGLLEKINSRRNNVLLLGKKEYKKLPDYLYYSTVGIIPFKINELTNSIYPVKLNEYFACGLPVVTTAFQEAIYIEGPHYVAHSYEDFADNIKFLATNNNNEEKYRKFAKSNDWQERFKIITDSIKSKKDKKYK